MRKLTLLALVALVAGTVYAETDPGFSGEFDFFATADIKNEHAVVGNNTGFKIALNGVIDEWTTVNATIEKKRRRIAERILEIEDENGKQKKKGAIEKGDVIITGKERHKIKEKHTEYIGDPTSTPVKTAKDAKDLLDKSKPENIWGMDTLELLTLNEFTMTNDLTGALGFPDSPVAVSLTWGKTKLVPANFHEVGKIGYLAHEATDSYYGLNIALTIVEKVKIISGIYPTTFFSGNYSRDGKAQPVGAIDVQLLDLVEGLNFNLFFTTDPHRDTEDATVTLVPTEELGLTVGYTGLEPWGFGLATSYDLESEVFDIGVSASYTHEMTDSALAFVIDKFPKTSTRGSGAAKVTTTSPIELYFVIDERFKAIPGVLDIVFNMKLPLKGNKVIKAGGKTTTEKLNLGEYMKEKISFDGGLEAYLGSVTYGLGYEHNQRNKYSPNGDASRGIYFRVKAKF